MNPKYMMVMLLWSALVSANFGQTVETVATAPLTEPYGVVVDLADNSYFITEQNSHFDAQDTVLSHDPVKNESKALVGGFLESPEGVVLTARLGFTNKVLVVSDASTHGIYLVTRDGAIGKLAGAARGSILDGPGVLARFNTPSGLAADDAGNVYVADMNNNAVRKIANDAAATVSTIAGGFSRPAGLAFGEDGKLFVADTGNEVIQMIDTKNGNAVTLIAGQLGTPGAVYGSAKLSKFNGPRGLVWVGGETGLLVSDTSNHLIRRVYQKNGGWLTDVFAGGLEGGFVNGSLSTARFDEPVGLALDANGAILVADLKNNALRRILRTPVTLPVLSVAGGSFSNNVTVTVTNDTLGTTFRFTTNGKDPGPLSSPLANPFTLTNGTTGLKVRGFSPDFLASQTVSNSFTFFVDPLQVSTPGGSYSNDVNLTITTATEGAAVRYVTSGAVKTNSTQVGSNLVVSGTTSIIAQGFRDNFTPSAVVSNKYTFFVAPVSNSILSGTYINDRKIALTSVTEGATVRFTTDGSIPDESSDPWTTNKNSINGILLARAFKAGYTPSDVLSNNFTFVVSQPVILPNGGTNDNDVEIKIGSSTLGSTIFWTVDDGDTENSIPNGGSFILRTNGTLIAQAEKAGYLVSTNSKATFVLKAATPVIKSSATNSANPVQVTIGTRTTNAVVYYTLDGSAPSTSSILLGSGTNTFTLLTNGVLKAAAFRDGYLDSETVSTEFKLKVATPVVTLSPKPENGVNIDKVTVSIATDSTNATILYSLDGSSVFTNLVKYSAPFVINTNASLFVIATNLGFAASEPVAQAINIQVPAPVMDPPGGFFQDGTKVTLSDSRADAVMYYSFTGDPTTNDTKWVGTAIPINQLSSADLRRLRVRAFASNTIPSVVVSGQVAATNTIGIARPVIGSMGSTVVIPVILSLKTNDTVRSIQYRAQIWPKTPGASNLTATSLRLLTVSTNDFVAVQGPGATTFTWSTEQSGSGVLTNELVVTAIGTQAGLQATEVLTLNMLAVTLPGGAKLGQEYGIRFVEASATADAGQRQIGLVSAPDSTITITPKSYTVGDTSISSWYNSGDFGDGNLDNSDVNPIFYASLGFHVPYRFSDVFDAMDAYPPDEDGAVGGDGQIRFLDWQTILDRSLRRKTNNWTRIWTNTPSGIAFRLPVSATLAKPSSAEAPVTRQRVSAPVDASAWSKQAMIEAGDLQDVSASSPVSVPVYLDVKPGQVVDGLQFLAKVQGTGPAISGTPEFVPASSMPNARPAPNLPESNEVSAAWDLANNLRLQNRQLVGHINFSIPGGAQPGDTYSVSFLNADGGANGANGALEQKDFESLSGTVAVRGTVTNLFGRLSDDWRQHFFGSLTNFLARPDADADGDGVTNWQEYLAGTNPAKLRLQLSADARAQIKNGLKLRWLALPGKTYTVESTADLSSGVWTPVISGVVGDGTLKEFLHSGSLDKTLFYRVRLVQ